MRSSRLQGDFYINQVLKGHGAFGDHPERFFQKDSTCFCGANTSSARHHLYECALWWSEREKFFPRDYQRRTLRVLRLDVYSRQGVRHNVRNIRTLDRSLGSRRSGPNTRTADHVRTQLSQPVVPATMEGVMHNPHTPETRPPCTYVSIFCSVYK